jgi:hypothetical protein
LCEYFLFHDNIEHYPNYCKNYIISSKNPYEAVLKILGDSLEAYLKTLYGANFNEPITIENAIYKYYEGKQNILMNYSRSTNFMRYMSISNKDIIEFDENLFWLMDVDYYKRLYDIFGNPSICSYITVVNREHENQVSNTLATEEVRKKELEYIIQKYK